MSFVQLCRDPAKVAPTLLTLLADSDPTVRAGTAVFPGSPDSFLSNHRVEGPNGTYVPTPSDQQLRRRFADSLPALARAGTADPDAGGRAAALGAMTSGTDEAPWPGAQSVLAAALPSRTGADRRTILRVFAFVLTLSASGMTPVRPALLDPDPTTAADAFVAVNHSMSTDGEELQASLLADLKGMNSNLRYAAVRELEVGVSAF